MILPGSVEGEKLSTLLNLDPPEYTTMKVIDYLAEELKKSEPVVDYLAEELKREQQRQQHTNLKAMGKAAGAGR